MATSRVALLDRLNSLCASDPFQLVQAISPFDFDQQPTGQIDQVFRITAETQGVIGGFRFSEERTDLFTIWLARKHNAAPQAAYAALVTDVRDLFAAIVRDGAIGGGDYAVEDGDAASFEHEPGLEFAVARLAVPINYEAQL